MQLTDILHSGSLTERYLTRKLFRVMRLTTVLLFIACLHVAARSNGQTITLDMKNVSVQKIITEASRQSGISVISNEDMFANTAPVSIRVKNASIEEVLNQCLKNQPFTYVVEGKIIVIKPISTPDLSRGVISPSPDSLSSPPPIDVHGRVTDSLGKPLAGASIIVKGKGKTKGTETDANGNFTLYGVVENMTIVVSFTGYTSKQYKISGAGEIVVFLNKSNSRLDEVQVIAYGTTTRRFSTGDVGTVTAKEIEQQPVSNPLLALEGRVTGLFITQSSGLPGGGVTVKIQGENSLIQGTDPLYVIDGVPYSSQLLPSISGILGGSSSDQQLNGAGNPLSFINPGDIESIDVLKDADATAIYGSRAANGAILITTKKGKAGETKVNFNIQNGYGNVTRTLPLLNTQQYLQVRAEAFRIDGATPGPYDYDVNGLWDTTSNTNWQKTLIGGTAQYTNCQGSISGGNANTQFLLGANYHREITVFPVSFADDKGSIHFNINNISANRRLKLQFSGSYLIDNNQLPVFDLTSSAIQLPPDPPPLYNKDGSLNWAPDANGNSSWTNPLSNTIAHYSVRTNNLIGNGIISYAILNDLELKSSFGYTSLEQNEFQGFPLPFNAPELRPYSVRTASYANSTINTWIIEPQLNYKRTIAKGKLDILIGSTFEENNSQRLQLNGTGYNSDLVLEDPNSADKVAVGSTLKSVYKYNAVFGRINYLWNEKYIIDLTARRDGSSRFGPNNQFHNFGAIAGAWIFSQEEFVKHSIPFLSFGKIRASYGTTGNDQIGNYQFLSLYNPFTVPNPYRGVSALLPSSLPNPDLQWEETKKAEFGLDLGVLSDRILLTANYFQNSSSNQLLSYALPWITGFSNIAAVNFPATVRNYGWEVTLNTINVRTKQFEWSTSINLTIQKNELASFPNIATSSYASTYVVGKPITIVKAYHFLGVDPATGLYTVADAHGTPTTTPDYLTDNTVLVNTAPKFFGGFDNKFSYRGFQLDILFQFVSQTGPNYFFGSFPGIARNQPTTILNHWQKPGDISSVERYFSLNNNFNAYFAFGNATGSDANYSDASFVRLKNLALSWQFPNSWKKALRTDNCRLYLQAQNLLTITKYAGLDPENQSTSSLPPLRVITIGVDFGL